MIHLEETEQPFIHKRKNEKTFFFFVTKVADEFIIATRKENTINFLTALIKLSQPEGADK